MICSNPLLVHIPSVIDFIHQKDIIFFVDAEDDPDFSRPHPQKALPFTLKPFDIKFFKRDNALGFDSADKGLELEANPLIVLFIELFEKLNRPAMESDPHLIPSPNRSYR